MTDFREEAYILEQVEVSEDEEEQDGFAYEELKDPELISQELDEDDNDLNDFEALKARATQKQAESLHTLKAEARPKVLEREVVIDDFIRNFLQRFGMGKTLNVFQQEWFELQKKGTFHDNHIGLITDVENKNKRLRDKVERMRGELAEA